MGETRSRAVGKRVALLLAVLLTVSSMVPAAAAPQSGLSGPGEGESIGQWTERWLVGPVRLIATREEQRIYAGLSSTQERLQFIRLFWERRDPHVRGPRNEYLDQFSERLAYTEEHFANSREPAWDTVFGQVVLMFGPPARTRRELGGVPAGFSDRPPILWSYDERIPGLAPNEDLFFVFRVGRWKLMSPYSPTSIPEALKQAERASNVGVAIPSDYQLAFDMVIEQSLAQPVNYQAVIDTVRTSVALPDAQIPFGYEIEQFPGADGAVRLQVELIWRMDSLVFHLLEGEFRTDMVVDVQLERDGELVAATSEQISITVPQDEIDARRGDVVRRSVSLTAEPGEQELVIVLLDQLLGYRTPYRETIEVR